MESKISERGNGLPTEGDFVPGDDGNLYRVVRMYGPIHTGQSGEGNWICAEIEECDWEDCEEEDVFQAMAIV